MSDLTFECRECRLTFVSANFTIEAADSPEDFERYYAECPQCQKQSAQIYWQRALMKAHLKATGPKTAEGKAKVRKNLEGHPTPEEAKRTRFNNMKHGLTAKVAKYFPAKPDKYPHCVSCQVDKKWCATQVACQTQTELFMRHQVAFQSQNPELLVELGAENNAVIQAILSNMMLGVISQGTVLEQPQFYVNPKTGESDLVRDEHGKVVKAVLAHPLLKHIKEFIQIANQQPQDFNMTRRQQDTVETGLGGFLGGQAAVEDLSEFHDRQARALESLQAQLLESRQATLNDPVCLEYRKSNEGDGDDV